MILRSRGCWIQIVHYHTEINFDVQLHFFSLSLTWGAENVSGKPRVNSKLPGGIELGVGRKQRSSAALISRRPSSRCVRRCGSFSSIAGTQPTVVIVRKVNFVRECGKYLLLKDAGFSVTNLSGAGSPVLALKVAIRHLCVFS